MDICEEITRSRLSLFTRDPKLMKLSRRLWKEAAVVSFPRAGATIEAGGTIVLTHPLSEMRAENLLELDQGMQRVAHRPPADLTAEGPLTTVREDGQLVIPPEGVLGS